VFSHNQVRLLESALGLPKGLVHAVPFGVTVRESSDRQVEPNSILTVGSDRGRDFQTFVSAFRDFAGRATIVTNPAMASRLRGLGSIDLIGPLAYTEYIAELTAAEVVVLPTHDFAYPTGQTVLLEAMSLGKPCVVTASDALTDYVTDGVDVLLVPPHDAAALRAAVEMVLADASLREAVAKGAARTATRFSESRMWTYILESLP
jgi:glycosyltransferase involved in cell wall biosynthesis